METATHLTIDQFNGNAVTFRGDAWVNATQMAKPFGKRPAKFIELPSTVAFMDALARDLGAVSDNRTALVYTESGGVNGGGGTWLHPDLALEFARWLSPEFAIWCNRVIRRILSGQSVEVPVAALAQAIDRMTATLQAFDARLSALEAARQPLPPEPRPPARKFEALTLHHLNRAHCLDVPTVAYALGVNLQDFYAWLRLRYWVKPGTTHPTACALAAGVVAEFSDGTRYLRTLITPKGLDVVARDFGARTCLGPFPATA